MGGFSKRTGPHLLADRGARVTRRQVVAGLFGYPLLAQTVQYRDYSRVLPDYIRGLADEAYRRRNAELGKLTTAGAVEARKHWARKTFWSLIGGELDRTPLNVRKTGTLQRAGYRIDKIVYESRPGFFVVANLYVPDGNGPFPGVLFQLGHSRNGKAYDSYQRCCQGLVKLGYVVLAFDPMGQGERAYYPARDGMTRLSSPDEEHSRPGRQMLLVGHTAAQMQVWDAIRSLDVLAEQAMVDPKRLASTGQSGGGTLTMMLAAVDDRLACAAVCSGNTENMAAADFHPPGPTDDAEQNWPESAALGWDRWDLLHPFAPKPMLIVASAKDFFGTYSPTYISNGRDEFAKLARAYETLGHADRVKWVETPQPHGLAYFSRLQVYNWFARWLQPNGKPVNAEPDVKPEPDAMLWATKSGSVLREVESKTPVSLVREAAAKIQTPEKPEDLAKLIGFEAPVGTLRNMSRVPSAECDVEAIEVESAAGVWCPAWRFLPHGTAERLVIIADASGRNTAWHEGELYQELAATGAAVCAVDVRGLGDLRPQVSPGAPGYTVAHASEEDYAWAGLVFGRSLLGQRVTDLLAFVKALSGAHRITLAARARMCIPALFAAALEPRIAAVHLSGMTISYRSILEAEDYREAFANFLPDVLRHADLPQIARAVKGSVSLAGVVDGEGKSMPADRVSALYGKRISVAGGQAWDVGTLQRL